MSVEELEEAVADRPTTRSGSPGCCWPPWPAAIGILVTNLRRRRPDGRGSRTAPEPALRDPVDLHELLLVLLVWPCSCWAWPSTASGSSWACVMALYGLGHLQPPLLGLRDPLHPGRGLAAVRSYRLQRDLKEATGEATRPAGAGPAGGRASRPRPNKRYTPPTALTQASRRSPTREAGRLSSTCPQGRRRSLRRRRTRAADQEEQDDEQDRREDEDPGRGVLAGQGPGSVSDEGRITGDGDGPDVVPGG